MKKGTGEEHRKVGGKRCHSLGKNPKVSFRQGIIIVRARRCLIGGSRGALKRKDDRQTDLRERGRQSLLFTRPNSFQGGSPYRSCGSLVSREVSKRTAP